MSKHFENGTAKALSDINTKLSNSAFGGFIDAFAQGRNAGRMGRDISECPYSDPKHGPEWKNGWKDGNKIFHEKRQNSGYPIQFGGRVKQMLAEGKTIEQIAKELDVPEHTVRLASK